MNKSYLLLGICLFAVGLFAGDFYRPIHRSLGMEQKGIVQRDYGTDDETRLGVGHFTNPLLECDAADGTITSASQDFKTDLDAFVSNLKNDTPAISDIAVSYRDLNNGPSFGINRENAFLPASLLKVPVMMAYYKYAEFDRSILTETIKLTPDKVIPAGEVNAETDPTNQLSVGKNYTISDLIERMIRYSDNQSLKLLIDRLSAKEYIDLFKRLGVDASVIQDPTRTISARQYSTFFNILYNASYLTQDDSEAALKLLTQSTFVYGLQAGVPKNVVVAHKFGTRAPQGGVQQLHDCGIIYYPKHPYVLCVMTKGSDISIQTQSVAKVSSYVYAKVDAQYKGDQ